MKYAWITRHRDLYPITLLCELLAVSKSGYYASVDRQPSSRAQRRERIQAAVRAVHAESQAIYGSFKIARELNRRDDLESACRNTVARAMQGLGLKSRVSKAFTPTTTQCVHDADAIRVIVEHRREAPVALFSLDGRPHLRLVDVGRAYVSAYQALLTEVVR